jgi:hypothetical protein
MIRCPFCQFENEDGSVFCDQCKFDLGEAPDCIEGPGQAAAPGVAVAGFPFGEPPVDPPATEPGSPFDFLGSEPAASGIASPPVPAPEPPLATPVYASSAAAPARPPVDIPLAAPVTKPAPVSMPEPPPTDPLTPAQKAKLSAAAPPKPGPELLLPGARPRLVVARGLKVGVEYPLYPGHNFIGRADEKAVDIDLEDQESSDRIYASRQHAVITLENGRLVIEDLNSSNYTFLNRDRVHPGEKRPLQAGDVIQIGTVQLRVLV